MADGVPIRNDTVWKDDRGQEIMCQGGSLCKFGDTFYFYGWADYPGDNRNDTVTCYSSKDLSNWKFERDVATYGKNGFNIVPDRSMCCTTSRQEVRDDHQAPFTLSGSGHSGQSPQGGRDRFCRLRYADR